MEKCDRYVAVLGFLDGHTVHLDLPTRYRFFENTGESLLRVCAFHVPFRYDLHVKVKEMNVCIELVFFVLSSFFMIDFVISLQFMEGWNLDAYIETGFKRVQVL